MFKTRRCLLSSGLKLAAGAAFSPALLTRANAAPEQALKSSAKPCGWQVGLAVDNAKLQNPQYAQAVTANFNLVTLSGMKWDRLHPQSQKFDFSEADAGMQFAVAHGIRVHGHNLCWNNPQAYPAWFKTEMNKSNAEKYLVSHINTVAGRYKGKIDSWDVVNEAVVGWSKEKGFLYPGIWLSMLGPQYIDIAFHAAEQADPAALRVLNIYHVEQDTQDSLDTRRGILELLQQLVSRKVPIQAVGIESHLDAMQPLGGPTFREFLHGIHSLGLQIMITELDVTESRVTGSSIDWDRKVAQYYGDYLDSVLPYCNARRAIFWALQDRWESNRRVQGLLQANFSTRLNFGVAATALEQKTACERVG
jgi:endo-1,4-beta-xylanase